jgi:catecholate siderophore receptor
MNKHSGRKSNRSFNSSKVSSVVLAALTLPSISVAADQQDTASTESTLPTIKVRADAQTYKVNKVQSPKYTESLRDTPQTITVLDKKLIEDQSMLSLREILSAVPGITFGAGEGGSSYGDKINIRGFNASNDITIDGLRESALFSRTDPFDIEQVEVVKGSNSTNSGSGSIGGSINLVSKIPENKNFVDLSAGIGTDGYYRGTVDANQKINDTTAVRVNLMTHQNDVPGNDVESLKRWGIAPSITFGMGTDTRFTLSAFYQTDHNTPQYGVPYFNGHAVPGLPYNGYYGYANLDEQKTTDSEITAIFEHEFNDYLSIRNITRAAQIDQYLVVDAPQFSVGNLCLSNGLSPVGWNQTANAAGVITTNTSGYGPCAAGVSPSTYNPSGPRGLLRDTTNKMLANETDLTWQFNTAGIEHTLVTGLALTNETYDLGTGYVTRNPGGALPNPTLNPINPYSPTTDYTGPINYIQSSTMSGTLNDTALYGFDTMKFSDQWSANVGLRYDHSQGNSTTLTYATPTSGGAVTAVPFKDNVNLWSYKAGLVYKPVESGTLYISYSNSKTPSDATVGGSSCTITVASATAAASTTCGVKPETAATYEIGTKWDVLQNRLSLTAALFDAERTNYKVADPNDPTNPSGTQTLDGSARVTGIELGAAGLITKQWSIFTNLTAQHSEVLQGASNNQANLGQDFTKGDPLLYVPKFAASLWTTYDITRRLQVGYGLTYEGSTYLTQHSGIVQQAVTGSTAAVYAGRSTIPLVQSAGYLVNNLAVTYKFTKRLSAQLNVKNLFDKEYYTGIRNNGWALPGDGRSAVLNINYHF